jgi:hypothetical protein
LPGLIRLRFALNFRAFIDHGDSDVWRDSPAGIGDIADNRRGGLGVSVSDMEQASYQRNAQVGSQTLEMWRHKSSPFMPGQPDVKVLTAG